MPSPFLINNLIEKSKQTILENDVNKALPEIQSILRKWNLNLTAELVYLPNGIMPKPVFQRQNYDTSNNPPVSDSDKTLSAEQEPKDSGENDNQNQASS